MERRNWTPQAMLYLRGAQGRRFISHQSRRKDVAERPPPERRSPNPQLLTLPEAAPVLMAPLQTHRKLEKEPEQMRFVEDNLLYW
ncbi:spexin [Manis javanica]|uniref:spexin n=1 Tax=Manis javanica TaxID=9974 RepID=UPI003C6CD345